MLDTLAMCASGRVTSVGRKARTIVIGPMRLTPRTRVIAASSRSATERKGCTMPALFSSPSTAPWATTTSSTSAQAATTSVTLKLAKVRGAEKVEITYGKKGTAKSGWKTKTVSATQPAVPIKGLKAKTTYTFTIRAYGTLTGYEGTKAVTVKVYGTPLSTNVTTKR